MDNGIETIVADNHIGQEEACLQGIALTYHSEVLQMGILRQQTEQQCQRLLYACRIVKALFLLRLRYLRLSLIGIGCLTKQEVIIRASVLLYEGKAHSVYIYIAYRYVSAQQRKQVETYFQSIKCKQRIFVVRHYGQSVKADIAYRRHRQVRISDVHIILTRKRRYLIGSYRA